MKLQKTPLILLLLAGAMGGGVYWLESRKTAPAVTATALSPMFSGIQESDIQAITITRSGIDPINLSFEAIVPPPAKPNEKSPAQAKPLEPQWLIAGKNGKESASPPSVAYLANLLATGKRDKELPAKRSGLAEFGLDQPMVVTFRLKNNQSHRLLLGKPTFNRSHLYGLIDPGDKDEDLRVSLVAIEFEGAVTRPLPEWKLAKPSPSPSSSPSSTPSPAPTPSPSVSPSISPSPSPTQTSQPTASPKPSPSAKPGL